MSVFQLSRTTSVGFVLAFVLLQVYASVWLVSDFNWINFIDPDDAYQVEQFLYIKHEDSIEGLPNWKVAYGSEMFLLSPVYDLVFGVLGNSNALNAYRFLKLVHIIAVGLSLLILWSVLRQSEVPDFVALLVMTLVTSSPRFFANALVLKPDANVVLLLLTAGFWALLKFGSSGNRFWLMVSLALAALSSAVKWWGIFLLLSQFYIVGVRDTSKEESKPFIGRQGLLALNATSFVLVLAILLMQGRYTVQLFPHVLSKVVWITAAATVVLLAGLTLITRGSSVLLRGRPGCWPSSCQGHLPYVFLSMGCFFVASYLIFAAPFLLSDQLQPSILYFSKYLSLSSSGLRVDLLANIAGWFRSIAQAGFVPLLLMPILVSSTLILLLRAGDQKSRRNLLALAVFTLTLLAFLLLLITKKNEATQALSWPFIVALALAPTGIWAVNLAKPARQLVLLSVILLASTQTILQTRQIVDVIAGYKETIETISKLNQMLRAKITEVSNSQQYSTLFLLEREFPVCSSLIRARHLTRTEWEDRLSQLVGSCSRNQNNAWLDKNTHSPVFIALSQLSAKNFEASLRKLRDAGCLELVSELSGKSHRRGSTSLSPFAYALYQVRSL